MKKGRFLWSAHRITEMQKAGKARNIKGKQLKNSRNTVSKPLVALRSSPRDNHPQGFFSRDAKANLFKHFPADKAYARMPRLRVFVLKQASPPLRTKRNGGDAIYNSILLRNFCTQQV